MKSDVVKRMFCLWLLCVLFCGLLGSCGLLPGNGSESIPNPPSFTDSDPKSTEHSKGSAAGNSQTGHSDAPTDQIDPSALQGKVVILDPGHGFGDSGCLFPGSQVCERDITPILVSRIRAVLEADGVTVLQTHDGQTFPDSSAMDAMASRLSYDLDAYLTYLVNGYSGRFGNDRTATVQAFRNGLDSNDKFSIFERSYYANLLSAEKHADLFVSIHVNSNKDSSSLSGFELYCCSDTPHKEKSGNLMQALENGLQNRFPQSRLKKTVYGWEDAFAVNKYPDMPSVLLESGYATNPTDAQNLQNEDWQNAFARAVADGIETYLSTK